MPDTTFENCPQLDLVCIGGGLGQGAVEDDAEVLAFLGKQGSTAKFITSVCGGSQFLARAGLLQGYRAATHWVLRPQLAELGVEVGTDRVVVDRNRITAGSPEKAGPELVEKAMLLMQGMPGWELETAA